MRLHTGDPCFYGAIREQMDILDEKGIMYDIIVRCQCVLRCGSALNLEYTLPDISQSVIITRMEGRTPVPIPKKAFSHLQLIRQRWSFFLSTGMLEELSSRLIEGGYTG